MNYFKKTDNDAFTFKRRIALKNTITKNYLGEVYIILIIHPKIQNKY